MRYYLIDENAIVAESAGDDTWCFAAMESHPDGVITDAPPASVVDAWRSEADSHHFFVSTFNRSIGRS